MKRVVRAKLARLYYELAVLPGMDPRLIDSASAMCMSLLANKKKLDINDLQLPWEPLYAVLERELFPKKRKTGITNISTTLLTLTEFCQRFFSPHEIPKMLSTFLPQLDGSSLSSILTTQSFMAHFLPLSHPQEWLTPSFVLWDSFSNSQIYTEQWLDVMSRLAEKHVDPNVSDPKLIVKYQMAAEKRSTISSTIAEQPERGGRQTSAAPGATDAEMREASTSPEAPSTALPAAADSISGKPEKWKGIRKDVGIFTFEQWDLLMQKTLRAMGELSSSDHREGAI